MDYLQWQSDLSLEQVFEKTDSLTYPDYIGHHLVYLTTIKNEKNRSALMMVGKDDSLAPQCITPAPFDLRTKINEYGGKPYWVFEKEIFFVNNIDQRLYRQTLNNDLASTPKPISPLPKADQNFMYADICKFDSWVFAVTELNDKRSDIENIHTISAFSLTTDSTDLIELVSGADFYSNLCLSPHGERIAWVQWSHPNMPWDETQLWTAEIQYLDQQLVVKNQQRIPLAQGGSVCQLYFANNGNLFFSVDYPGHDHTNSNNFWNIKSYDFVQERIRDVTFEKAEFGYPHWQYGDTRIVQFDETRLLSFVGNIENDQFCFINQESLDIEKVSLKELEDFKFQSLSSNCDGRAAVIAYSAKSSPVLLELIERQTKLECKRLVQTKSVLSDDDISVANHFSYPTSDENFAHGYYYAPTNSKYQSNEAPPLIVMVHGGPTARAYGYFDLQKQFWTSRGFAIFDVNHRGSSGYGRAYRDALLEQWGNIEISDINDGIDFLVEANKADPDRICIRGKSAGGYTVLRALTERPLVFKAGACYYGIGNLATLAQITHKFEKHYTDRLIGEKYDAEKAVLANSNYFLRSPIHKVGELQTAMIIFQGLEDKIVPPAVAQEIVSGLEEAGVTHSYVEYSDEGHGFRKPQTNIDAWSRELAFYQTVLSK